MKRIITMFVLLSSFAVWQGCGSEKKEAANEALAKENAALELRKTEGVAAKKAEMLKVSAEIAKKRSLAADERARLSLTYKDAMGRVVYNKAEVDPSYTGGMDAFDKYLSDNLRYPVEARDRGIEGTVFVDFVIDKKGRVREVIATDVVGEDVDQSLKEEAVRVVASAPGWKAGLQHGKAVDVSYSLPISFEIVN